MGTFFRLQWQEEKKEGRSELEVQGRVKGKSFAKSLKCGDHVLEAKSVWSDVWRVIVYALLPGEESHCSAYLI